MRQNLFPEPVKSEIAAAARKARIEPAALLAIVEVESNGRFFAKIGNRSEPLIRFEGHYFHRLLDGEKRTIAVNAGLAAPKAGAVANPRTQEDRWKLLKRARMIDATAALCSTSWGAGQVMGAHWQALGYRSIEEMVERARAGIDGQVELMLRFIERNGLGALLNRHDWLGFAKAYNGPAYAQGRYHLKMATAYRRHARNLAFTIIAPIKRGDTGEAVLRLQRALDAAGFPVAQDGNFGFATTGALTAFQRMAGLDADGIAGPLTLDGLYRFQGLERKSRLPLYSQLAWMNGLQAPPRRPRRMDRTGTSC